MKKIVSAIAGLALIACAFLYLYFSYWIFLKFARPLDALWVVESYSSHMPVGPAQILCYFLSWIGPLLLAVGLWRMGAIRQERASLSALPALVVMAGLLYLLRPTTYKLGPTDAPIYDAPMFFGQGDQPMRCVVGLLSLCVLAYCALATCLHLTAALRGRESLRFSVPQALLLLGVCAVALLGDNLLYSPAAYLPFSGHRQPLFSLVIDPLFLLFRQHHLPQGMMNILSHLLISGAPALLLYLPTLLAFRYEGPRPWAWGMLCAGGLALTAWLMQDMAQPWNFHYSRVVTISALCLWLVPVGITGLIASARAACGAKPLACGEGRENAV